MPRSASRSTRYGAPLPAIWAALISVYLIWGSTYLAIRFAVETAPPFLMAAARFLVSGGALYAWRRLRGDPAPRAREWVNAGIIGLFLLVGGNGGVVWAEQFVESGLAALVVSTVPLWLVLLDAFRPRGRWPRAVAAAGVLLGFGGVALLVGAPESPASDASAAGSTVLVLASLLWAAGSLYGRNAELPASPLLGTAMEMLTGGVALALLSMALGEWNSFDAASVSARSAWALLYLTVVGSSAFVAYVWLLRVAPTPLVATYAYVNPLVAVLLGHFLAAEPLGARTLLAGALIIGSVILVSLPAATRRGP
ncbi:MAG TPA: EamA family transporter [candidate division Zixibacteria bacterium]|nr:EamA family transporter [candidate division Zixibacteria bacterium]